MKKDEKIVNEDEKRWKQLWIKMNKSGWIKMKKDEEKWRKMNKVNADELRLKEINESKYWIPFSFTECNILDITNATRSQIN